LTDGAEGHRLHGAVEIGDADIVLNKYRYSAFIQNASEIDARLRALGVDTLIVAGTLTNVCCESSARDAYMLGYRVLFAADATAAVTDTEHNAALLNLCLNFADVRTMDTLLALIGPGRNNVGQSGEA
ncbi:MAG: cysteine hydrolase, partial [Rhodospirillales bacterium]|nr:cysteine hydrolase [Rhodospirillales bacterium]